MGYVVVLVPVLLLAFAVAGLVYAYRRLSLPRFFVLICALFALPTAAWNLYVRQASLEQVPDELGVSSIIYRNEASHGFGPSGNEAGVLIYRLPQDASRRVADGGTGYLEAMPSGRDHRRFRGVFSQWKNTPIQEEKWGRQPVATPPLNVIDYLCTGICIELPRETLDELNAIVNSPGSFYAKGTRGIIVVSPARNLVIFMFTG